MAARRMEDTEAAFDLLALCEGDLGEKILSYASASDLCALDALSKRFQRLTTKPWKTATMERFGMQNGKEGWKVGTSFLRKPTFIHPRDEGDFGYGDSYMGRASVASNGSIIAAVADDVQHNTDDRKYPDEENGVGIRDAFTLNYIRTAYCPIVSLKVGICGPLGAEIIVTSNPRVIFAFRGNNVTGWPYPYQLFPSDGIPLLGCETHLLVNAAHKLEIYRVNPAWVGESCDAIPLLSKRATITVTESATAWLSGGRPSMSWGPDKTHFIVGSPFQISVWRFEATKDTATLMRTIETGELAIGNTALADEYIVGSAGKMIHVWSRSTGEKLHEDLSDVEPDEDPDDDEWDPRPVSMSCHGHLLVSTSRIGCALCIWNIKTGKLLKRYNHASDECHVDMLPGGFDVDDMTYVEPLNAFLCMSTGFMNMWSFPFNKKQKGMAKSIRRREEFLRRALCDSDSDDGNDDESSSEDDVYMPDWAFDR